MKFLAFCSIGIFALAFLACKNTEAPTPPATSPTPDALSFEASTPDQNCAPLEFARPSALAAWSMANATVLYICAFGETWSRAGEYGGWLNVYWQEGDRKVIAIPQVTSELPAEDLQYSVKKIDAAHVEITRSHLSSMADADGSHPTALTTALIDCSGKSCRLGQPKCGNRPGTVAPSVRDVHELTQKLRAKKPIVLSGRQAGAIGELALSGIEEGLHLLLDVSPRTLGADGAVAEALAESKTTVQSLIDAGCIHRITSRQKN